MRRSLGIVVCALSFASVLAPAPAAAQVPYTCMFGGLIAPGASIDKSCLAISPLIFDSTVYTFVDQASITVYDENGDIVALPDSRRDTFIGFFRLSVSSQRVLVQGDPGDGEAEDRDVLPEPGLVRSHRETCTNRALTDLVGDPNRLDETACRIGRVRSVGTPWFVREYFERLTMLDEGNQTEFAGWGISFNEVRRFLTPARVDCAYWDCPAAGNGLYER